VVVYGYGREPVVARGSDRGDKAVARQTFVPELEEREVYAELHARESPTGGDRRRATERSGGPES
jgi:hypothetical protein